MNREGTLYEIAHFAAVFGLAYFALSAVRALGVTALRGELFVALLVGIGYVLLVLRLGIAPPSWRGE